MLIVVLYLLLRLGKMALITYSYMASLRLILQRLATVCFASFCLFKLTFEWKSGPETPHRRQGPMGAQFKKSTRDITPEG